MSVTFLPSGALHPDLVNHAAFVKTIHAQNSASQTTSAQYGCQLTIDSAKHAELAKEISEKLQSGELTPIEIKMEGNAGQTKPNTDKIIIDNKDSCGLIIGTIQPGVVTASDANKSAAMGAATHGFLYQDTSFLMDAAKEYATLGENEEFLYRNINDVNYVRDALDFFTGGNYTQDDVHAVQEQMTDIVRELAQQIKDGKSPDLNELKNTLTIGGVDVTIAQLTEMQQKGQELQKTAFDHLTIGTFQMSTYGKIGLAQATAHAYGNKNGEAGALFSAAIDRLAEKATAKIERDFSRPVLGPAGSWTEFERSGMRLGFEIVDQLASMKSGDFSSTISTVQSMVKNYCAQYHVSTSSMGLARDVAELTELYQKWAEM